MAYTIRITLMSIVMLTGVLIANLIPDGDTGDSIPVGEGAIALEECTLTSEYSALCGHAPPVMLDDIIDDAASEYSIDPWLIAVTVYRESGCDQYALGSAGEIGLAQINPSVWMRTLRREGIARRPQELYDVRANLRAAAYILRRTHDDADGDLFGTFRRYNGRGPKARQYAREQVAAYTAVAYSDF